MLQQLAALSLDGLFKTIWFLGHRLGGFESCTIGHGRKKANGSDAIEVAHSILSAWPYSLSPHIGRIADRSLKGGPTNLYRRAFQPVTAYIEQQLDTNELTFLRIAYEREIRKLWRQLKQPNLPKQFNQLEFDFLEHCHESSGNSAVWSSSLHRRGGT